MKNILFTGGAGYIGSITVKKLLDLGHKVTVIDNLSKGKKELVDKRAIFHNIDILNLKSLEEKFKKQKFDVIMHFAALKDTGESMTNSDLYQSNIIGVMNLTKLAPKLKVQQFIFASTSSVYGETGMEIVDENHLCAPTNFYGYTKLAGEHLLEWMRKLSKIDYVSLRYFNVVGDGGLGYIGRDDTSIFNVLGDVLCKRRKYFQIYGNDYNTPDGTGIRDYVHVLDIANAHIKAMDLKGSYILNLGSDKGYSVLEIMKEFEKVSKKKIQFKIVERREGDVSMCVATSKKAKTILKWKPKYGLRDMVESTWKVYSKIK